MPNKYEREIEEILRNMERSAPKPGLGQRMRRKPEARGRRPGRLPSFRFGLSEWCLLIAFVAALAAGGWAYAHLSIITGDSGANIVTGSLAILSVVCLLIAIVSPFLTRARYPGSPTQASNVTAIRRNPLNGIRTRWNLFLLKLRYRRRRDK
jgi:hypothetical protein